MYQKNIQLYANLNDKEISLLHDTVEKKTFHKHEVIFTEGNISNEIYFVTKGCVRLYYLVDGNDKTAFFYAEGKFICAGESYTFNVPARENYQAIEQTEIYVLTKSKIEVLLQKASIFDVIARIATEDELKARGYWVRVLIRRIEQQDMFDAVDDFFLGQITEPESLTEITADIDWVFSSIGITRQKDGMTYMDVDYKGNSHLLTEAMKDGVTAFQYVSAINGNKLRQLKIFEAKERFVDELKDSGIPYSIIRPNGFFSDMKDFLEMAKGGRVYLFGDGSFQLNPIHGEDLAKVCVEKMIAGEQECTVGGPDILSQNELAELALATWNKPMKITHLPDWTRRFAIWLLRTFTSSKTYGPIEFFLTAMATDNIADRYGTNRLKDFFHSEASRM